MNNLLLDNSCEALQVQDVIVQCLKEQKFNEIMIATAFWDMPGMALVINELDTFLSRDDTKMRLIIGRDPEVKLYQLEKPNLVPEDFPGGYLKVQLGSIELKPEYQHVIELLIKYCSKDNPKIEIRVYGNEDDESFLHAKCYIFAGQGCACGLIGSSNFTAKGLRDNAELNYLETDPVIITAQPNLHSSTKGHIFWFEEKWAKSRIWTETFIEEIVKKSPIGQSVQTKSEAIINEPKPVEEPEYHVLTPYEVYIRILQEQFADIIDQKSQSVLESYLPNSIDSLDYQIQAVQWCYAIMRQYGGFMLGDVVGLGKTIVGVLLTKYYIDNAYRDSRDQHVLIIAPPAIIQNWKDTIDEFDKNRNDRLEPYIDYITTGSIRKINDGLFLNDDFDTIDDIDCSDFDTTLDTNKIYGLILIDESHKFRHSDTQMYRDLDELIRNIGNTDKYPYIGLLSATPQNNTPEDLKNQIYLFERNHKNSHFEKIKGRDIESFFAAVQKEYTQLKQAKLSEMTDAEKTENQRQLVEISEKIRHGILEDILVRRTRTDIEKSYKTKLTFPEVKGPIPIRYEFDTELAELFSDTMKCILPAESDSENAGLGYYRYRAIQFLDEKYQSRYEAKNLTVESTSVRLANIMKILLVKRLESSFAAFKESLSNLREYTNNMIMMWEHDSVFICPQIDVNAVFKKAKETSKTDFFDIAAEILRTKIQKLNYDGKNLKNQNCEYHPSNHDLSDDYLIKLKQDTFIINELYERWFRNSYDPKEEAFKACLRDTLFDRSKNTPQKLVIFSEAIATVKSLERILKNAGKHPLIVTAANRSELRHIIEANFDANYKLEKANDYDVIITTEVLAEGVNLHRSNTIVNYDTPWNATRLIQRIGRVNRIGSNERCVYVYNFYPSAEGDHEINLIHNAYSKLQSFHTLFGEDSKVFSNAEILSDQSYNDMMKQYEGGESPMLAHIEALRQFYQTKPKRYAQLLDMKSEVEAAFLSDTDEAMLLVKTPPASGCGFGVHIVGSDEPVSTSTLQMLDLCRCAPDSPRMELDTALLASYHEKALLQYNTSNGMISKPGASNNQSLKAAKAFLNDWLNNKSISSEALELLKVANKLVKGGNADMVTKILSLKHTLESSQKLLFGNNAEIETIITRALANIAKHNAEKHGEPYIFSALYKVKSDLDGL